MNAAQLLAELRADAMVIELHAGLVVISPQYRITDQLRVRVSAIKPALVDQLTLEHRVRDMCKRWRFSFEDTDAELRKASLDPELASAWVDRDELHFGACRTADDFAAAYRRLHGLQ